MKCSQILKYFIDNQYIINNSPETISYYKKRIGYFIDFVRDKDVSKLRLEDYNNYVLYLRNKRTAKDLPLSSYTIRTTLNAAKIFIKYCYDNNYLKDAFYKKIKPYKSLKKTVVVLSPEEIQKLLNTQNPYTIIGCRNLLIISLMLDAGLRLKEVCFLDIEDFNLDLGLIRILGKGNKERLVPITDSIRNYFTRYLFISEIHSGKLFIDFNTREPLTPAGISQIFRRIKKEHNFKQLHPHFLRHTFATLFIVNGGDPIHLKLILGHTTLYMTEHYIDLADQVTLPKQKIYSPLTNIQK